MFFLYHLLFYIKRGVQTFPQWSFPSVFHPAYPLPPPASARLSGSPSASCQQFTRLHPVWSNKETSVSCSYRCRLPQSAHPLSPVMTQKRTSPHAPEWRADQILHLYVLPSTFYYADSSLCEVKENGGFFVLPKHLLVSIYLNTKTLDCLTLE